MPIEITILGCGSATPVPDRNPSSQFVRINQTGILIDCGEGSQMQMTKFNVKHSKIDVILISHLHGDHYFGLAGLISTMHLMSRKRKLILAGPHELWRLLEDHFLVSQTKLSFEIDFKPIHSPKEGLLFENEDCSINTFPLHHRIPCQGFVVKEKQGGFHLIPEMLKLYKLPITKLKELKMGKDIQLENGDIIPNSRVAIPPPIPHSYAYCSDTAPFEELVTYIQNVNLIYHEATFDESLAERAHQTFHSTAKQAATHAKDANAGKLIIGHFSSRYRETELLLNEACSVFPNTIIAKDGLSILSE